MATGVKTLPQKQLFLGNSIQYGKIQTDFLKRNENDRAGGGKESGTTNIRRIYETEYSDF